MKKLRSLTLLLGIVIVLGSSGTFAAPPAKAGKKAQKAGKIIAKYDRNKNGFIDADEVEAIQKAFATDPALKQFDRNGDGKLDDTEVSAMNPQEKKKKK